MSEPRLKYGQLAPEGMAKMQELEHYLNTGAGLEASLLESGAAAGFADEWVRVLHSAAYGGACGS